MPCCAKTSNWGFVNLTRGFKVGGQSDVVMKINCNINTDICGTVTADGISLSAAGGGPVGWKGIKRRETKEK